MPTFDRQDKFSPDKAFSRVVWGERSKVLETELSEMQKILQHQTLALGEAILSNGFVDELPNITYENDELTIDPCAFVIDGFVYRVQSPLVLSQVQPESTVYIEVSEAEVSYQDTIRKDGNYTDGGEDLPDNGILDPDFGAETTRRVQWQIRLVTDDSDESKRYLPVCTVHGENAGVWEYEDLRQLCSLKSTYDVARKADVDAVDSAAMKKVADSDLDMNNRSVTNILKLNHRDQTTLTISNGAITVTQGYHTVDTEGGAPQDELTTINGGSIGDRLLLRPANTNRKVTIKGDGSGNIYTFDRTDIAMESVSSVVELIKINVTGHWYVIGVNGVKRAGDAMRGPLSMGGYRITDLAAPTNANDAARKAEVDAITTEKINTTTYKTASEPGSSYPIGITTFSVTDGIADGWPVDGGVVLTIRLSNVRCLQIISGSHASNATNGRLFNRSWRSDIGWSDWRRQWDDQEMGAGSGLDADMLDGIQAERFIYGDNARGTVHYAGDLNNITKSGFYYAFTGHSNGPSGANGFLIHHQMSTGNNFAAQTFIDYNNDSFYFRRKIDGAWQGWKKIWNESNDGPGSGLDADTVDGLHASSFWTKSELGSDRTRKITISTSNPSGGANGDIWFVV